MATARHIRKQSAATPAHPSGVQVLDAGAYERVRKEEGSKTLEIHLTPALFPSGEITPDSLKGMIAHKAPASKPYNIVFHFGRKRKSEFTEKLVKARQKMSNQGTGWYIVFTKGNRAVSEARVQKIVPQGLVKSSDIDAALADQS